MFLHLIYNKMQKILSYLCYFISVLMPVLLVDIIYYK